MVNVLGQHGADARADRHPPGVECARLRQEPEVRHDRKMGHITVLTDNPDATVADLEATGCWDDLKKKA